MIIYVAARIRIQLREGVPSEVVGHHQHPHGKDVELRRRPSRFLVTMQERTRIENTNLPGQTWGTTKVSGINRNVRHAGLCRSKPGPLRMYRVISVLVLARRTVDERISAN